MIFIQNPHTKVTDLGLLIDSGFKSATGNQEIDLLLSRGGIESMMSTVSLIILTLSLSHVPHENRTCFDSHGPGCTSYLAKEFDHNDLVY